MGSMSERAAAAVVSVDLPNGDPAVASWLRAQTDVAASLRVLINTDVADYGQRDVLARAVLPTLAVAR